MSFAGIEKQLKQNRESRRDTATDYFSAHTQPSLSIPQKMAETIEELLYGVGMLAALLPLNQESEPEQEPARQHPI